MAKVLSGKNRIAVIGGGAAGLMAAIFASREGSIVTLFEKNDRVGRKLLQTGNGKCNFTNINMDESFYHGSAAEAGLVKKVLEGFSAEDCAAFFKSLGVESRERKGCLYPYPETASAVLDVLRFECERLGVNICIDREIKAIKFMKPNYSVGDFSFNAVIIATGGLAAPKTGSTGDGYGMAKAFSLSVNKPLPALTLLKTSDKWFKGVEGIRAEAGLRLFVDGKAAGESRGELQLIKEGVSGICAFDLSGAAARALDAGLEVSLSIDFLPNIEAAAVYDYLKERRDGHPERRAEFFFTGLFHKRLSELFLRKAGIAGAKAVACLTDKDIAGLSHIISGLRLNIDGTGDFSRCQVTCGGVMAKELNDNLMAKKSPGLFFCGEVVDADGPCGGYNLQWAFSSGVAAGRAAALYG